MLFDTDVLIFVERGHQKAAQIVADSAERFISVQTYMELLQGRNSKTYCAASNKNHPLS